jgi:hypothetical protein
MLNTEGYSENCSGIRYHAISLGAIVGKLTFRTPRAPMYRSLNAIVAQPKDCLFGVNTTIELKYITTTSENYGISGHVSTKKCAGIVGCNYIF